MENPERLSTSFELLASKAETNGRRSYMAILAAAGRDRRIDDEPGRRIMAAEALDDAVRRGLFTGLAMFIDHPGFFEFLPSLKNLAAITTTARFEGGNVIAEFTTYDNEAGRIVADLFDQVLDDEVKPDIGSSLHLFADLVETDEETGIRTFMRIRSVVSADFVFKPGLSDARVLSKLSALFEHVENSNDQPTPQENKNMDDEKVTVPAQEEKLASPVVPDSSKVWLDAQRDNVLTTLLNSATDLPEQVRTKLLKQHQKHPFNTPEELNAAITDERETLATVRKDTVQMGGLPPRGGGHIGSMKTSMDHMQSAVDWLFGVEGVEPPDFQFRNMAFLYQALTGDRNWYGVFDPDAVLFSGADTTSLSSLAKNAMNKVIISEWAALNFYRWYELVVSPEPNDGSVQQMTWASEGGIGTLPTVSEKEAYDELTPADVEEVASFIKYGGYVGVSLEVWRNSDVGLVQRIPKMLAAAAVKTRSSLIAALFTTASGVGPTLGQDSTALFHSDHGNVATTALGTDTTAWEAASLEVFNQNEIGSGDNLGIFAKFLLVPGALYFQGLKNFGYGDGNPTTYNPFAIARGGRDYSPHDPRPIVLAVPNWTDATDWAAVADPMLLPAIHMSYAQSPGGRVHPPPELFVSGEARQGLLFTNDTMPIKIRDWFAYGVSGYRGLVKRNVAG